MIIILFKTKKKKVKSNNFFHLFYSKLAYIFFQFSILSLILSIQN